MNLYQPGLAVFSEWLNDIAEVQDELLLSSNPNADRAKSSYKEKAKGSTFATSATNRASDNSKYQRECVLKDGKHPIWKCEKFKKMNVGERTKDERTEAVLQMLVRRTSDEKLLW